MKLIIKLAEEGGIEPRAPLDAPLFSKQVPEPSGLHLPEYWSRIRESSRLVSVKG